MGGINLATRVPNMNTDTSLASVDLIDVDHIYI